MVLVYEIPHSDLNRYTVLTNSLKQLAISMNLADHDCIRLGVIVARKELDVLVKLNCPYGISQCYLSALKTIEGWAKTAELYQHDKRDVVGAVDMAIEMLSSGIIMHAIWSDYYDQYGLIAMIHMM